MNKREGTVPPRGGSDSYEWLQCLVAVLLLCIAVFTFFFRPIAMPGDSMQPTLSDGDGLLVSRLSRDFRPGDIVAVRVESYKSEPLVKRVIAVAGQTVSFDFDAGVVYVDGAALNESYIYEPTRRAADFTEPVEVPEGCVFLLGDNRNNSVDSRSALVGCVDARCILGKVVFRAWPLSAVGAIYGAKEG